MTTLRGRQARKQDDLCFASEFTVAAGQLRRVGARRDRVSRSAVNVQNLAPAFCKRSKVVDGLNSASATFESSSDRPESSPSPGRVTTVGRPG